MPNERYVKHANLMSMLTLVSRFAGLARDKVCSYYVGVGWEWSAFWIGFTFPNLFRRIFGEGALSSVFVPVYADVLHKEGNVGASKLASVVVTLLVLVLGGITVVGELIAIPIAMNGAVGEENRLAAAMIAVMLPYCVLVCVVALLGAMATVHERFAAQSLSPVVLNLFMTGAVVLAAVVFVGNGATGGGEGQKLHRVFWVAGSVVAAGIVQVLLMVPTIRASGIRLRPMLSFGPSGVDRVIKALLPILVGYSAVQINTALDSQIAWWLSPDGHGGRSTFAFLGQMVPVAMHEGAVAKLSVAQRIYLLPVGIFGVSMAMAIFPHMARAASGKDMEELKRLLVSGLRKTLFLSIPASFGMILIAKPLITLVYLGGQTTPGDVDRAFWASIFFCMGIWAFEAQLVITRVFFVLGDTWTPTKVSLAMIVLNLALNLLLVWPLQEGGIALSTTIAAIVQGVILMVVLRKRLGVLGAGVLCGNVGKSLLATAVMVAAGFGLWMIRMPWEGSFDAVREKWLTALVRLPLLVAACGGIYLVMTKLMGMPEVADVPVVGRWLRKTTTNYEDTEGTK